MFESVATDGVAVAECQTQRVKLPAFRTHLSGEAAIPGALQLLQNGILAHVLEDDILVAGHGFDARHVEFAYLLLFEKGGSGSFGGVAKVLDADAHGVYVLTNDRQRVLTSAMSSAMHW